MLPVLHGRGGCGRGDPSPSPERTLLRAGFARCRSGTRVPGGRGLMPLCGVSWVRHSTSPHGPTTGQAARAGCLFSVGAGSAGVGTRHTPLSARSGELALHAVGAARGCLGGGASCLCEGCLGLGTIPPPTARPCGGRPGPAARFRRALRERAGTRHLPHSARSCELVLCAVGTAPGHPERGTLCPREGCPGFGTIPLPTPRPWDGQPGPAACFMWARGMRTLGPATNAKTHVFASWPCTLWWRHKGSQWKMPRSCVRGVLGQTLSLLQLPILGAGGRGQLPFFCGHGGCGPGDRSFTPQRTLLRAGFACCGRLTRAPGGGCLLSP